MNHPTLVAAPAYDRRHWCPCGAVSQQPDGLCRGCRAAGVWWHKTLRTNRHATFNWAIARTAKARPSARVASLLQISSKGVVS